MLDFVGFVAEDGIGDRSEVDLFFVRFFVFSLGQAPPRSLDGDSRYVEKP